MNSKVDLRRVCQAFVVGLAANTDIFEKHREFFEPKSLRAVDEGNVRVRMEIDQDHVRTRDHTLSGYVHHVEDVVRASVTAADRV